MWLESADRKQQQQLLLDNSICVWSCITQQQESLGMHNAQQLRLALQGKSYTAAYHRAALIMQKGVQDKEATVF